MEVFVSMITPRGDSELHRLATLVTEVILQAGFISFVATDEITELGLTDPNELMPFVRQHCETSDLMIVFITLNCVVVSLNLASLMRMISPSGCATNQGKGYLVLRPDVPI
jgi:hypothetical protein